MAMVPQELFVNSEITKLQKVIIHRPDSGIGRISPRRSQELLFDDIVHLPLMQEEHDQFSALLRAFLGHENVLEVEDLIRESLEINPATRSQLIDKVVEFEEVPTRYGRLMKEMGNEKLAQLLISGYSTDHQLYMFDPIPNFIFTRDIAVTVNDHIIITKAAKLARQRENLLTRFFFYTHPLFKSLVDSNKLINLNTVDEFPPSPLGSQVSLEGGDLMMIESNHLLVGCSERTTDHAFHTLKDRLFATDAVDHMVQVSIPRDRSFMHIDTIFTRIDERDIVAYKPIVVDGLASWVDVYDKNGGHRSYPSIKEYFTSEIRPDMRFILSGKGKSPYQEREQWTDGCNLVSLAPGVAVTYDRNLQTIEALEEAGYQTMTAEETIQKINDGSLKVENMGKTIITLASTELSRARGGSHCMTCPIQRTPI